VTEPRPPRAKRSPRTPERPAGALERRDPLGRMALFSDPEPEAPPEEHLFVECSSCLKETPVSPLDLVKSALPLSIHLPLLRRHPSFMRCPACGRRTWVRVRYRT
jgi:uncharacterized protein with PIN domain